MLLNVNSSIATFGNTPKVDTKATMKEKKMTLPKEKKNDIKLSGSQVMLYVDQWGCVK